MMRCAAVLSLVLALWGGIASAQGDLGEVPLGSSPPRVGFLVIDQDRFFTESEFGKRVQEEIRNESVSLAEENRRIEAALIEEERLLTERRPTLPADEFRALADEFDARVVQIRAAQDRKARSLAAREEEEQRRFLGVAIPVLGEILQQVGATAIMDRRSVFVLDERIDVTSEAIAAVDAQLGDGTSQRLEGATGAGPEAPTETDPPDVAPTDPAPSDP